MKKLLVFTLVLGYLIPVYGAESKYKEEAINLTIGDINLKVEAKRTSVDGSTAGHYSVKNLFDGNKSTAWVTRYDKDMTLSDEWLLRIIFQEPIYVRSMTIRNGYQKTAALYSANQRIKKLSIEKVIVGGRTYPLDNTVTLKDDMDEQEVSLNEGWTKSINLFKTKELIFNATDVYSGTKYDDLCISELRINFSNNIDYLPSTTWKDLKKLIDTNKTRRNSDWSWGGLNEKGYKLFNDLLYYVLTGNKEAYLYFDSYLPEGAGDSAAMKTIYRPAVNESLKLSHK